MGRLLWEGHLKVLPLEQQLTWENMSSDPERQLDEASFPALLGPHLNGNLQMRHKINLRD